VYWFSGKYLPVRGACAEQGDNEHILTLESLKKFIPVNYLWRLTAPGGFISMLRLGGLHHRYDLAA